MSIFRKDKPENIKKSDQQTAEPEEFTDISAAEAQADDSDGGMEEIYSTTAKKIKYKRLTPIEAEAAAKRQAATKEELIKGKLEFKSDTPPSAPEVELKSEPDPEAVIADEIIEDIGEVRALRGIYVQDIDEIDISLDPMDNLMEYERAGDDRQRHDARVNPQSSEASPYVHKGEKIIAYVPVYRHESRVEKVFLKAGRFTSVVEAEYDEYLKSTDPSISKDYHAMQKEIKPKQSLLFTLSQMAQKRKEESEQQKSQSIVRENFDEEPDPQPKKRSGFSRFLHTAAALIAGSFIAPPSDDDGSATDYNSREDEKYVLDKIRGSIKKRGIDLGIFGGLFAASLTLSILERSGVFGRANAVLYCGLDLIVMLALMITGRRYIADGLRPLRRFRGNSNTAAALACCGCLIQSIGSMFTASSFTDGTHHLYAYLAAMALALNALGHLLIAVRVRRNFRFITSHSPAYAAKIYNDEETARRMVSGTTASKGVVAYQHITRFLSDFLKISYAPDPSEELSGRIVPVTVIASLFVTIMYGILFRSFAGCVSALAVMLCVSVPFTAMLAGNIPMLLFSKKMLGDGAMVAGYPSVRQFCDTTAVIMNANELFPAGSVKLEQLLSFQQFRVEDSLISAAAVLTEAGSPIAPVFDELIVERGSELPRVESVVYEDKSGLVGWIGGERILIGNLALMNRYHISIPEIKQAQAALDKGRELTYIACSGQAVAALILRYTAPRAVRAQMQSAENSGLAFVVSSPDPNVTAELVAREYGLFYRSVKIMSPGYAIEIDEVTSKVEETSRAYLATRGRQSSLARAVGGCIGLRSNINLSIAIGMFGLILGILLCATLVLYASAARLSVVELMIYILFWTAASLAAALIRKP